jgi:hypothetical protein
VRITVTNSISLDGVMQAPGTPDEDRRDDFPFGGWAVPYNDPVMMAKMGEGMARPGVLLPGSSSRPTKLPTNSPGEAVGQSPHHVDELDRFVDGQIEAQQSDVDGQGVQRVGPGPQLTRTVVDRLDHG